MLCRSARRVTSTKRARAFAFSALSMITLSYLTIVGASSASAVEPQVQPAVKPVISQLEITSMKVHYEMSINPFGHGSVVVQYVVRNTGNVLAGAHQVVRVGGMQAGGSTGLPDISVIEPGHGVVLDARVNDVPPAGRLAAEVLLAPRAEDRVAGPAIPSRLRHQSFTALPVGAVATIVLAFLACLHLGLRLMSRVSGRRSTPTSRIMRARRALLAAGVAAGALAVAAPAHAVTTGDLAVSPIKGHDNSSITVTTQGPCPAGNALIGRIFGRGFPPNGQNVVANTQLTAFPKTTSGGLIIPFGQTIRDFENQQDNPVPLGGSYRVVISCRDKIRPASLGDFATTITFTSPRDYAAPAASFTPTPRADPNGTTSDTGITPVGPSPPSLVGGVQPGGSGPSAHATPGSTTANGATPSSSSSSSTGTLILLFVLGVLGASAVFLVGARLRRNRSAPA